MLMQFFKETILLIVKNNADLNFKHSQRGNEETRNLLAIRMIIKDMANILISRGIISDRRLFQNPWTC